MNTLRRLLGQVLQDKVGLICYTDNPEPNGKPIMAGVNCTYIKTKWDPEMEVKGEAALKIFGTMDAVMDLIDAYDVLKTDVLLTAMGLYVSPQFRGQGLGLEILLARDKICKALGIKAAVTTFTATVSQVLAEKAGYKVLSKIPYSEVKNVNPDFVFPGIEEHTEVLKYMYKVF